MGRGGAGGSGRGSDGRGGRGSGSSDTGRGTSVGGSASAASGGNRDSNRNTNASVGGGHDRGGREARRGNAPATRDLIKDIQAEMDIGLAPGTVTKADIGVAGSLAVQAIGAMRRGVSAPGFAGGIAKGDAEETARTSFAAVGVDFDTEVSKAEQAKAGLGMAQEVAGISKAAGMGVGMKDLALGTISNPTSAIAGFVGEQIGRLGAKARGMMSEAQLAAGPSQAERDEAGRTSTDGGSTGSVADIGTSAAIETPEKGTEASLADTGEVETRSRSSLDIRRRTRPASFLGGQFALGTQELTG